MDMKTFEKFNQVFYGNQFTPSFVNWANFEKVDNFVRIYIKV